MKKNLTKSQLEQRTTNTFLTSLFFFLLLTLFSSNLKSQIIINEIQAGGNIELKNTGTSMVNVGDYILCDFPSYAPINSLNLDCGNLLLPPGEILTVTNFNVDSNDGEMGLYINSSYSDPNSIIDYVEWGSSGHQRASVAIAAGIWSDNMFVSSFNATESIEYDGDGNLATDWGATASSTFCAENSNLTIECDVSGGTLEGGPFAFCVDGIPDMVSGITLAENTGMNNAWLITDLNANILGLPPMPGAVDFDAAGTGVCLIWNLSYDDGLTGLETGNNIDMLDGCFALSNSVIVYRETADGGTVSLSDGGTEYIGEAGDIIFDVSHSSSASNLSYWYIITDADDNILEAHNSADGPTLDLSGAPAGECHIWGWSQNEANDPIMGENISTLSDGSCEEISSNFITVLRLDCVVEGGTLDGGPFTFCVDGIPDMVSGITLTENTGLNSAWLITDQNGNILGLPPMPGVVDFDAAGAGVCLIWNLSYGDDLTGLEEGNNIGSLGGCYDLSNSVTVYREIVDGGIVELADGGIEFSGFAGDIVFDVSHISMNNNLSYWYIITDADDNILETHNSADGPTLDLSGAPVGECHIWGWSHNDANLPVMGENISTLTDDSCEAISGNFITVTRLECAVTGGTLEGGPFTFCVDGNPDMVSGITLSDNSGMNDAWVITDEDGNILGLPPMPGVVDFDAAGAGVCLIWNLTYEDGLTGLETGNNVDVLNGCFALSNSVTVYRETADGGTVELSDGGTEYTGTAGNIVIDVTHATTASNLSYWYIITDADDNILEAHNTSNGPTLDLSGAPAGECHIWGWSQNEGDEPVMGENISTLADGSCEAISSNFITVIRLECTANGGNLEGGPFEFCVDGTPDMVSGITLSGNEGLNSAWVITDESGLILGLPDMPGSVDFDGAGAGICLIWNISYEEGLVGLDVDANVNDINGCFEFSNSITVTRVTEGDACVVATDEEKLFDELVVYPNPSDGFITLEYETTRSFSDADLIIRNQLGQIIQSSDLTNGNQRISIDLSDEIPGSYILQIRSKNLIVNRNLIIIK